MLNIDKLNDLFNSYYIIKYYFKYFSLVYVLYSFYIKLKVLNYYT